MYISHILNEVTDMTLNAKKSEFAEKVNKIYGKYGKFRFRKTGDINASYFDPMSKEIVIKFGVTADTLAHELAHAFQYYEQGDTCCMYIPLCSEHCVMESDILEELKFNGLYSELHKLSGIY